MSDANTVRLFGLDQSMVREATGNDENGRSYVTVCIPVRGLSPDGAGQIMVPAENVQPSLSPSGEDSGRLDIILDKDADMDVAYLAADGNVRHGSRPAADLCADWMAGQPDDRGPACLRGVDAGSIAALGDGTVQISVRDAASSPAEGKPYGVGVFTVPEDNVVMDPQGHGYDVFLGRASDPVPGYKIRLGEATADRSDIWSEVGMTAGDIRDVYGRGHLEAMSELGRENLFERDGTGLESVRIENVPDAMVTFMDGKAGVTLVRDEGDYDRPVHVIVPSSDVQPSGDYSYDVTLRGYSVQATFEDDDRTVARESIPARMLAEDWANAEARQEAVRGPRVWLKGVDIAQMSDFEADMGDGETKTLTRVTVPDPSSSPRQGEVAGYGRLQIGSEYIRMREDGKADVYLGRESDPVRGYEIRLGEMTADHSDIWEQVDVTAGGVRDACAATEMAFGSMMPDASAPEKKNPDRIYGKEMTVSERRAAMAVAAMGENACGVAGQETGRDREYGG